MDVEYKIFECRHDLGISGYRTIKKGEKFVGYYLNDNKTVQIANTNEVIYNYMNGNLKEVGNMILDEM